MIPAITERARAVAGALAAAAIEPPTPWEEMPAGERAEREDEVVWVLANAGAFRAWLVEELAHRPPVEMTIDEISMVVTAHAALYPEDEDLSALVEFLGGILSGRRR